MCCRDLFGFGRLAPGFDPYLVGHQTRTCLLGSLKTLAGEPLADCTYHKARRATSFELAHWHNRLVMVLTSPQPTKLQFSSSLLKTSIRADIANTSMIRRANFWELESMKATSCQLAGKKFVYFFQRVLNSRNSQNRFKDCAAAVDAKSFVASRMRSEGRDSSSIFFPLLSTWSSNIESGFRLLVDSSTFAASWILCCINGNIHEIRIKSENDGYRCSRHVFYICDLAGIWAASHQKDQIST